MSTKCIRNSSQQLMIARQVGTTAKLYKQTQPNRTDCHPSVEQEKTIEPWSSWRHASSFSRRASSSHPPSERQKTDERRDGHQWNERSKA